MSDITIRDGRSADERGKNFLPGMGKPWLLPLYDTFGRLTGARRLHARTAARAGIAAGQRVLDVGCGTAGLSLAVLRAAPGASVTAADPDAAALRIAARKARRRGVRLELVQAYADHLPAEDASLDHVVSSLALHHVDEAGRTGFAREVRRVLKPGGTVTIADFSGPGHGSSSHGEAGHGVRHRVLHNSRPNFDGGIVTLLRGAGLADVREVDQIEHRIGEITIVQATCP